MEHYPVDLLQLEKYFGAKQACREYLERSGWTDGFPYHRSATCQGAAEPSHLDYWLDESTFRFNRWTLRSRGKVLYHLAQWQWLTRSWPRTSELDTTTCSGY